MGRKVFLLDHDEQMQMKSFSNVEIIDIALHSVKVSVKYHNGWTCLLVRDNVNVIDHDCSGFCK